MAGICELEVRFFSPPDDLAPCFTTFYRLIVTVPDGGSVEDALHPEWANLRFFSGGLPSVATGEGQAVTGSRFVATGPSSRAVNFTLPTTRMWGIGLLPLGWARFIAVPAATKADTASDGLQDPDFARFAPLLAILDGCGGDEEREFAALIDFFRALAPPPADEARILRIHKVMIDPHLLTVEEFAASAGCSKRTLERCCARHFGFPPRLLLRRQRMMRSLTAFMLGTDVNWSEVIDRHYHDQAHFVHEFHTFMGMSPSQYAALDHPILSAFMFERQRVWGSPAQTLDRPEAHPPVAR